MALRSSAWAMLALYLCACSHMVLAAHHATPRKAPLPPTTSPPRLQVGLAESVMGNWTTVTTESIQV